DELLKEVPVRLKRHSAVKEGLQVWPDFKDVILAFQLHNALDQQRRPCGDAGDVRYVYTRGLGRHFFDLFLPVGQQRRFQTGGPDKLRPGGKVLHNDRRYISVRGGGAGVVLIDLMTAPYREAFSVKQPSLGIV